MKKYRVILADPPWFYDKGYDFNRSNSEIPYPTMKTKEIAALPVKNVAAKDCALFLWTTCPKLSDALEVINKWGFRYITLAFVWVKTNKREKSLWSGLGHWTNSNAELCLFAKRGHPKRVCNNVKQVIFAPTGKHSAKPTAIRERIETLMGNVPRIELFAREQVSGWNCLGNEIDGRNIKQALNRPCGIDAA